MSSDEDDLDAVAGCGCIFVVGCCGIVAGAFVAFIVTYLLMR